MQKRIIQTYKLFPTFKIKKKRKRSWHTTANTGYCKSWHKPASWIKTPRRTVRHLSERRVTKSSIVTDWGNSAGYLGYWWVHWEIISSLDCVPVRCLVYWCLRLHEQCFQRGINMYSDIPWPLTLQRTVYPQRSKRGMWKKTRRFLQRGYTDFSRPGKLPKWAKVSILHSWDDSLTGNSKCWWIRQRY